VAEALGSDLLFVDNGTQVAARVAGMTDFTTDYTFDAVNRITRIEQGVGVLPKRVDLGYDAAGQFTTLTRYADLAGTQNVVGSSYTWDDDGRLTGLSHGALATYGWTYDDADRLTHISSPDGNGQSVALIGAQASDVGNLLQGFINPMVSTQQVQKIQVAHAQITELDEQGRGVVRLGAAALKAIKPGHTIFLLRPQPELEAAPELIPLTDARSFEQAKPKPADVAMPTSINNLKQIGLAMHNFHNVYGHFPPAVMYGPDGKPWYSWRVLLLPFLDQQQLYDQYRFDEPWDGPHNKQLIAKIPKLYCDPIHGPNKEGYAHYVVAVGQGTAFPPEGYKLPENPPAKLSLAKPKRGRWQHVPGSTTIADFRDGTSNSLLAGSVGPDRKIPWTKPEDVTFDEHFPGLGKPGGFAAPYKTAQGAGGIFLLAEGWWRAIREDADPEAIRHLILIADGTPLDWSNLPSIPRPRGPGEPTALPVLELTLDSPQPSARLVLEPIAAASGAGR